MEITKALLTKHYITLGKSSNTIAKELGVPRYFINNKIKKFDIKMRTLADARRNKASKNIKGFKWCNKCKLDKPFNNFNKSHRNRLGLDTFCKSCVAKLAHNRIDLLKLRRQIWKAKLVLEFGNQCLDCKSINLPIASYVFHHHSERMNHSDYKSPSYVISSKNIKLIMSEKTKWILLCANCHSVRHSHSKNKTATQFEL